MPWVSRIPGLSKSCVLCGKNFVRKKDVTYQQWEKAKYCSHVCQYKRVRSSGPAHRNWSGGEVKKTCEYCHRIYMVRRHRIATARYCSTECKVRAQDKGISTENERLRRGQRYKTWRAAVFARDNFTCVQCGKHGGELNADHIEPFAFNRELRFEVSNGQTLCVQCHRKTPTFGTSLMWQMRKSPVAVSKGY